MGVQPNCSWAQTQRPSHHSHLLSHLTPPSPHCPASSAITTFSGFAPQMPWIPHLSAWAPLPWMVPTHCPLGEARMWPTLLCSPSPLPPHCVALGSLSVSPSLKGLMGTSCRQMIANVLMGWPHQAGGLQGQAEAGSLSTGLPAPGKSSPEDVHPQDYGCRCTEGGLCLLGRAGDTAAVTLCARHCAS